MYMKSSNIGGQAVMEGVMMKNGSRYAVAVRKEDGEIVVKTDSHEGFIKNKKILSLPIIRGVFNFVDSLVLGMKTLTYSAGFFMEEAEEENPKRRAVSKEEQEKRDSLIMGVTVVLSILLAVGLFMVLPYFVSNLFRRFTDSQMLLGLFFFVVRLCLFIGYILLISRMKDIQRVFQYHGAEHKCINCIEHGLDLNVENVMESSKQHKRCGTSFLLIVMLISVVLFLFIRVESPLWRVIVRILLVPVIAGISYEFIRLAGRSENRVVEILSKPGLWMQNLTTKEPDESMIEVAICSVEAVFDWKAYLTENFGKHYEEERREKP